MDARTLRFLGACLLASWLAAVICVAQDPPNQRTWDDFQRIADETDMLRRMAEIGGPVGTCEDFLAKNPPRPARFGDRPITLTPPGALLDGDPPLISILVESSVRPAVDSSLTLYANDLLAEGYAVYIDDVSGGTPEGIRDWVRTRHAAGSEGVVFIGGITPAWFQIPSEPAFPCDLYYMDVDGDWTDGSGDGILDTHLPGDGDCAPEVYIGRLYTPSLTWDTPANLVNGYLQKTHAYRSGALTLPRRGLEFIDHDWIYWFHTMGLVYEDVVRWDWGHLVRTDNYLSELARGFHYVHVAVHSGPDRHYFSSYPTNAACYAHVYVYSPYARPAKVKLGSCDGIKVWFDGDNILTQDTFQPWEPDQFVADIWLSAGWHSLLCKISTWGGDCEFSARFTSVNDTPLYDLGYQTDNPDTHGENPVTLHTSHIGLWLLNGLYENSNNATRLSRDYLGDEANVAPSEGEPAAYGTWDYFMGYACPVGLADHYELVYWYGEECEAQDIQDVDPQAFFYNLFACSSGRITETNYLSAAYILNTTYGLACVASSRSGSMTVPELFASSFGDGKSFGQAYHDWWVSLEPYYAENIGWWYGLILNGDPTLRCDQILEDCNQNGIHDPDEVAADPEMDCDENGIPDECDIAAGRAADCNSNGVPDECDIASGSSPDNDGNGVPDECDCPGDLDGDWDVDLADLAALLSAYGTCHEDANYDAAADLDNSGCVELSDLAMLLGNYGIVCN